ncbi:MAG TPA: site-2 protease family protein [Gemmatimonadaceae bacterium]|nr:site-2 protease family protein [Gemmatimonadaceae bacterium]
MTELAVTEYFTYWRNLELGDRRILEGLVAPGHAAPSPALERRIAEWDGYHYWQESPEGRWLVLVSEASRPSEKWWLHAALMLITLGTMTIGGAVLAGVSGVWYHPSLAELRAGIPFSLPLFAILLAHESGHYMAARYYRVNTSPPFFIPFPAQWNIIGTMGAFIRIRSPVFDRRTLFDIGVAGPIAGLVVAIPVLLIGLSLSVPVPRGPVMPLAGQYIPYADGALFIGNSLLLSGCRLVLGLHGPLHLHPVAIAGWVGVLVTSLNLLPLAQLDGGHVAFAMFGRAQTWIARAFWLLLIPLGYLWWYGWWLWAVLGLVIGRGRLAHPMLLAPERPLDRRRQIIGWLAVAIFVATFMPLPWLPMI